MLNTQLEGVNIPFCTLVMKLAGETTYSQMTKTCERRKLETFIKEYLVANPISAGKVFLFWVDGLTAPMFESDKKNTY